jgi:hypothetical protein
MVVNKPVGDKARKGAVKKRSQLKTTLGGTTAWSGNGRCSAFASSQGARSQTSRSSSVIKITGIAFGWIGSTMAFSAVVRKPNQPR